MLSQTAIADIEALEAQGLRLTPAEIVRLNCLGLRMARHPYAADIAAAPRVGWAGPVPIHQPTLASEAWVETYPARWWTGDTAASALLYACAHATVPGFFRNPDLLQPVLAADTIMAWAATLPCTEDQLKAALEYALTGNNPGEDITPEPSQRPAALAFAASVAALTPADIRAHTLDEAVAAGLGLSLDELASLTHSRLISILRRARRNGVGLDPSDNTRDHAAYARTLLAIKARALSSPSPLIAPNALPPLPPPPEVPHV